MGRHIITALGQSLLAGLRAIGQEQLRRMDEEAQRSMQAQALILGYGVATGLLLGFAWLGLCGAGVLWLMERQFSPGSALLLTMLLNLCAALGCALALRRRVRLLALPGQPIALGSGMLLWQAWHRLRTPPPPAPTPPQ